MRIRTLIGFGAGYVLGARAGRDRYEQIRKWFLRLADTGPAQAAQARGKKLMGTGVDAAKQVAADGLSAAADQLRKLST